MNGSGSDPLDLKRFEQALTLRLGDVERENERLRKLVIVLAIGLVGAAALALAALVTSRALLGGGSIQAAEFVLRDETGLARGRWNLQPDGSTALMLADRNGIGRVRVTVLDDGSPGLALTDTRGRSRVVLSLLADMTGTLVFADEQGTTRTVLGLGADGSATVVFADINGATRAGLGVEPDGSAMFALDEERRSAADTTGSR